MPLILADDGAATKQELLELAPEDMKDLASVDFVPFDRSRPSCVDDILGLLPKASAKEQAAGARRKRSGTMAALSEPAEPGQQLQQPKPVGVFRPLWAGLARVDSGACGCCEGEEDAEGADDNQKAMTPAA